MTYGIWNSIEKRFVFGIAAETPRKAERAFRKKLHQLAQVALRDQTHPGRLQEPEKSTLLLFKKDGNNYER